MTEHVWLVVEYVGFGEFQAVPDFASHSEATAQRLADELNEKWGGVNKIQPYEPRLVEVRP